MDPHERPGNWTYRRRFMYAVALFCAVVIAYVLYTGQDSEPAETAVTMAFVALMSIVGSYVFGAAWEHQAATRLKDSENGSHTHSGKQPHSRQSSGAST